MDAQHQLDENGLPTFSCSNQATASPSRSCRAGAARSPSKLPTLSDIAARLNRDTEASTPTASPIKQMLGSSSSNESPRPRLELTGRITGSPKPLSLGDRKSPLMPVSPSKPVETKPGEQSRLCLSPQTTHSGASSPTKRMLANGLPSLEEIRDRLSRKGLASSSEHTSPNMESSASSPRKLAAEVKADSPDNKQAVSPASAVQPSKVEEGKPVDSGPSKTVKPVLKVATNGGIGLKLTHPLPAPPVKVPCHPLQHEWTLFFDTRSTGLSTPGCGSDSVPSYAPPTPTLTTSSWEANLRTIGVYSTVETFLHCFSKLHRPSQLERHSSYHLFKDGIKPMWEDPRNESGGKWTITFRQRNPALVDRSWLWLVLGLIGEEMDENDETCGAVCSVKPRGDRIALWVRNTRNLEAVNRIGKKLISLLELEREPGISLEFTSHSSKHDDEKREGLFSMHNPTQPMARTPTISTFGPTTPHPTAGPLTADVAKHASTAATSPSLLMAGSPTSPKGRGFSRGHQPASPNADAAAPFGRLSGQPGLGRSPVASSVTLGQSLGLGINTPPTLSPNLSINDAGGVRKGARSPNPFQQNAASSQATLGWRSNRSPSPQSKLTPSPELGSLVGHGSRSRSASPFKAD